VGPPYEDRSVYGLVFSIQHSNVPGKSICLGCWQHVRIRVRHARLLSVRPTVYLSVYLSVCTMQGCLSGLLAACLQVLPCSMPACILFF
jgi:hypothetical protein